MIYAASGGTDVIQLRDVPSPEPGPHQVRVRVRAAGLNRADILQRKGRYPAPPGWPADIPGLEYAGEIESLGEGVSRWRRGDRVMGLVGGGAHAEFVVVHQDETMGMPAGMPFTDAAAVPEAFLTAYDALVFRGRLQRGERVLIHAAGSGVGTAACQIARHLGATVLGTSRTPEKLARTREYGLDVAIETGRGSPGFLHAIDEPVHVILDVLGGTAFNDNLAALGPRGRLVILGLLTGPRAEADLSPILRKRLEIIGSVMRARTLAERIPLVREFMNRMLPLFEAGPKAAPLLRPVVGRVMHMSDLALAHAAMERDETFGKTVLEW
ncbi:MAG: NAD(P)H-quinone oxidoreductase [Gemmatimonadales bacterium]